LKEPVLIIGAGPAGLTAAYELSKAGVSAVVLEMSGTTGGLARTVEYKGYLFDIGGHRFFTKVSMIDELWREVMGDDFLLRQRLSRIYYNSKFFLYPLEPWNALHGMGLLEAVRCGFSYLKARLFPVRPEDNFEAWIINRFGARLYEMFFRTYTEKVWGIPCHEIEAEWAAQRIKGLSLFSAVWNAVRPQRKADKSAVIKTLIHQFHYPRRGPGMMWARFRERVEAKGSRVVLEAPVEKIYWEPGRVKAVRAGGVTREAGHVISSMPVQELIRCLEPAPPDSLAEAAGDFHYRDFLTVALIMRGRDLFPDNWIYVHDADVRVGRIQNYKNWSPEMVPDPETTCLGLEYFCFEGDDLWTASDDDLIELGKREVARLGLAREDRFLDGTVVRMPKAYPVYDGAYRRGVKRIREFLSTVPNLQLVGRNGMHHYNNQDHSMLTGILAARNILGGSHDLWSVNVDAEYHEDAPESPASEVEALRSTQPRTPGRASQ